MMSAGVFIKEVQTVAISKDNNPCQISSGRENQGKQQTSVMLSNQKFNLSFYLVFVLSASNAKFK